MHTVRGVEGARGWGLGEAASRWVRVMAEFIGTAGAARAAAATAAAAWRSSDMAVARAAVATSAARAASAREAAAARWLARRARSAAVAAAAASTARARLPPVGAAAALGVALAVGGCAIVRSRAGASSTSISLPSVRGLRLPGQGKGGVGEQRSEGDCRREAPLVGEVAGARAAARAAWQTLVGVRAVGVGGGCAKVTRHPVFDPATQPVLSGPKNTTHVYARGRRWGAQNPCLGTERTVGVGRKQGAPPMLETASRRLKRLEGHLRGVRGE